jgi:dTDP-4-dehydrorhamnose 3,5-epimerase
MKVTSLGIEGAWLIEAPSFPDNRGFFREWYVCDYSDNSELPKFELKQANTSTSSLGVIRGIHFTKEEEGQSKIVTCTFGRVMDVMVDLRSKSPTFKKIVNIELDYQDGLSLYISSGIGHGFQSLVDNSVVTYLLNRRYEPSKEIGINPIDPDLDFGWHPIKPIISEKDLSSPKLAESLYLKDLK